MTPSLLVVDLPAVMPVMESWTQVSRPRPRTVKSVLDSRTLLTVLGLGLDTCVHDSSLLVVDTSRHVGTLQAYRLQSWLVESCMHDAVIRICARPKQKSTWRIGPLSRCTNYKTTDILSVMKIQILNTLPAKHAVC